MTEKQTLPVIAFACLEQVVNSVPASTVESNPEELLAKITAEESLLVVRHSKKWSDVVVYHMGARVPSEKVVLIGTNASGAALRLYDKPVEFGIPTKPIELDGNTFVYPEHLFLTKSPTVSFDPGTHTVSDLTF